jgi:hypothetical protein
MLPKGVQRQRLRSGKERNRAAHRVATQSGLLVTLNLTGAALSAVSGLSA